MINAQQSTDNEIVIREEQQAQHVKQRGIKAMNLTLARILRENEYRRLLDFLADNENFKNIQHINEQHLRSLIEKMTDMLSYKAEAYIEESLPWIKTLLIFEGLVSVQAAEDLHYVIRTVLGADRKRKTYQHQTVEDLESLLGQLESVIQG